MTTPHCRFWPTVVEGTSRAVHVSDLRLRWKLHTRTCNKTELPSPSAQFRRLSPHSVDLSYFATHSSRSTMKVHFTNKSFSFAMRSYRMANCVPRKGSHGRIICEAVIAVF